jgi:ribosomal protein S18
MLRKNFFSKYSKCVPIKVNANLLFQNSKPNFFCTKDSDKNYNKAISNGIQSPGMFKKGSEQEANIGAIEKHRAKFNSKEEKEARMKLLQREITSNPEFFNAFPHLKEKIKLDYMESTNGTQEVEGFLNQNFFIKPSEESQEKKSNYFESLLNKHSGYSRVFKDESEKKLEDDGKFIDGYHTQTGPIKFMTREEKEKVHLEIDKKMRELEDSGLSRQEILFNEPEGIPLKQDKFYQFIKNNKIAREMLVKPTETFSVDLVIEKALKQDIGPDGSLGLKRRNFKLQEDLPLSHELKQYRKTFDPKRPDEMLQSDDFDYRENYVDKLKKQVNFERKKPISFINPPLMRAEARKKFMIKTIQKKDIHWKNLPLLARFLNEGGKMMNKYQTRLPGDIHKKLSRVIKHARHMGLLPNTDFIKPFHKVPFTSMYNEFADDVAKVVDKKTGIIKIIHQPTLQDKYNYSSYDSAVEANKSSLDR